MALIVQKYGGTSVGTIERIHRVAERVAQSHRAGDQVVVVLSAMSGETDRFIKLAHEAAATPDDREMDMLLSTGERVTVALLATVTAGGTGVAVLVGVRVAVPRVVLVLVGVRPCSGCRSAGNGSSSSRIGWPSKIGKAVRMRSW